MLVTTDFSLEGVHFRRDWHSPLSVGHRCLARGLSDIAAMGGKPLAAFLSLAVPKDLTQRWVNDFMRGLLGAASRFETTLAGGDTAQSPGPVLADIVVVGSVPAGGAVLRSGAKPGDSIYVTGQLGASAAVLAALLSQRTKRLAPSAYPRHFFPEPRIEVGTVLRKKNLASAMIDLSDGLSTDLSHICEESGTGAVIWAAAIPRAEVRNRRVNIQFALHGGEDYELLFTSPRKQVPPRIAGVRVTKIGVITSGRQMWLREGDKKEVKFKPGGWEHLR